MTKPRSRTLFTACAAVIAIFIFGMAESASAGSVVGKTVKIQRTVIGSVGNRTLSTEQPIHRTERISAKTNSHGELRLMDNSRIVVGANSSIQLDEFVVAGKNRLKKGTIKVSKGAFRFISGNSAKGTYTVKTPSSSIGVRGTVFDVYVKGGVEYVLLLSGQVNVCNSRGCQRASRSCDIIRSSRGKRPENVGFLGSRKSSSYKSNLSLVWSQKQFSRKWRAPIANCAARASTEKHQSRSRKGGSSDVPDRSSRDSRDRSPSPQPTQPTGPTDSGTPGGDDDRGAAETQ